MAADDKKGSSAAPWFAVIAIAGIAGLAYVAYRKLGERGESNVDDLIAMANKATRKLEDRLHEFAAAVS